MALGVKLFIVGASLVSAACGGYVIYSKVSGSGEEKTQVVDNKAPTETNNEAKGESEQPKTVAKQNQ